MSTFTQFLGGSVPVGGIIQAPKGLYQVNPSISGSEYLQTGNVKAYSASYAGLVSAFPPTGNQLPTSGGSWYYRTLQSGTGSFNGLRVEKGGTYYYGFFMQGNGANGGTLYAYGSSIGSAAVGSGGGANNYILDSGSFNSNAICSFNTGIYTGNSAVGAGALQLRYTDAVCGKMFAFSPTLGIAVRNNEAMNAATAGFVCTTTDGVTWTDRTLSVAGATAAYIRRVTWSTIGNCFIFVTDTGLIYTSTDGYTLTSRTAPAGMTTSVTNYCGQTSFNANTSSATLISLGGRSVTGGPYVLKTTNGTTFTLIDLATAPGLAGTYSYAPGNANSPFTPNIAWDPTTSKLVISCTAGVYYGNASNAIAYSTDSGATWTLDSTKFLTTGENTISGMNATPDGNFMMGIGGSDGSNWAYGTAYFWNNKVGNTPDYVGYSTTVSTNGFTGYLRIA